MSEFAGRLSTSFHLRTSPWRRDQQLLSSMYIGSITTCSSFIRCGVTCVVQRGIAPLTGPTLSEWLTGEAAPTSTRNPSQLSLISCTDRRGSIEVRHSWS